MFTPKILHNHCFQFLLDVTVVPREIEDDDYANFWGANKVHYDLCENGELPMMAEVLKLLLVVLLLNYDFVRAHSEDLKMGYRCYRRRYSVLFTKHILEEIRKSSQNLHRVL